MQDHVRRLLLDRHAGIADDDLDGIGLEVRQQRSARFRLLEAEETGPRLHDRDLGAEPGERLGKLHAHGPATQHDQPLWQLARDGRLAVGPEVDLVQTFDRRDRRGAAVGDHHRAPCCELVATHLDRAQVDELSLAADELGTGRLQRRRRTRVVEVPRHPQHALGNLREVDVPIDARGRERARAPGFLQRLA